MDLSDIYLCLLCNIYVIDQVSLISCSPVNSFIIVQDFGERPRPYIGTKGSSTIAVVQRFFWVRFLLIHLSLANLAQTVSCRFFGIFGVYYSLHYLSLSDATVLTFLAPMCTAMAGAFFLGEKISLREVFAGRK